MAAGRTGQEYNLRKNRKGAFWEDRYHATAVESNRYLRQCITYIDTNMVRAGVVKHPSEWEFCGYNEIQNPRKRKGIIDFDRLTELLGFGHYDEVKDAHFKWADSAVPTGDSGKEDKWTQSIAVGSKSFVERIKESLGFRAAGRKIIGADDTFELREGQRSYGEAGYLYSGNTFLWDRQAPSLIGRFLREK